MRTVRFLSDEWLDALDRAARSRTPGPDDPLSGAALVIEQVVTGERSWRLEVDHGHLTVTEGETPGAEPDLRLTSDRATAAAIAAGERAALDAFIAGDLVLGGDVRVLLEHRSALESLGDLFAAVRSSTDFS